MRGIYPLLQIWLILCHNRTHLQFSGTNYDNLLDACVNGGQLNVALGMGTIKYTSAGAADRASLVARGWTITDGGQI